MGHEGFECAPWSPYEPDDSVSLKLHQGVVNGLWSLTARPFVLAPCLALHLSNDHPVGVLLALAVIVGLLGFAIWLWTSEPPRWSA